MGPVRCFDSKRVSQYFMTLGGVNFTQTEKILVSHSCILPLNILTSELLCFL